MLGKGQKKGRPRGKHKERKGILLRLLRNETREKLTL